jgi:UDP-N-acetylglucosamine acyltransferase
MPVIDPTARVESTAQIADNVAIGPYCTIGPHVSIASGCRLHAHVHVTGRTFVGARTVIYPFASLGTPPQSVHYKGEDSRLIIGADCDIREGVTMNIGTGGGRMETRVGERGFFMVGAHVGHDCIVGDDVVFANNATLGGHCTIGDFVFIGGFSAVHQHLRVGDHVMVGAVCGVRRDVIPFATVVGDRGKLGGLNLVGLKRRQFSREAITALRSAYRILFFGPGEFADRVDEVDERYSGDANVQKLVQFIRAGGKRGLTMPASGSEDE